MLKKPDKKSLLYLSVVAVIAILVCVGSFYFLSQVPEIEEEEEKKPTKKSAEEILKSLTAPEEDTEVLKDVMEDLSAPSKKETPEASEEILKNLTVPK